MPKISQWPPSKVPDQAKGVLANIHQTPQSLHRLVGCWSDVGKLKETDQLQPGSKQAILCNATGNLLPDIPAFPYWNALFIVGD